MKKNYTSPFWWLLALVLLYIISWIFFFHELWQLDPFVLLTTFLELLMVAEVVGYWLLRKINIYRRLSRTNVLSLYLKTGLPFLSIPLGHALDEFPISSRTTEIMIISYRVITTLQWALTILAHMCFVLIVVKCIKRKKALSVELAENPNILDDVLT